MPNTQLNKKFAQFRHFVAKFFITLFVTFFALFTSSGMAFAAENEIKLSTDTADLAPGQEVTVKVELPDSLPIYALTATLQYDQNIFEPIATADFTVPETTHLSYNAKNQEFGLVTQSGAVDQNLFTLRLRVKDDPGVGDTNIALTNITSADGSEQTKYSPAITAVSVTKDVPEGTVIPVVGSNEIVETSSEPTTVFATTPFIVAGVLILISLVIVAVVYYRRTDENRSRRPIYIILGAGVTVLVLLVLFINFNHNKKDINHDGETGYDDAVAIIDYLINATGSRDDSSDSDDGNNGNNSTTGYAFTSSSANSAHRPSDFDTNNDGQVDIGDAGHNAEQAQKETKVSLSLSDQQSAYVEKGFKELKFAANVEPAGVYLQTVTIGDQVYNAEHSDGTYIVQLPPYESAGKQDLTITEVTTTNHKTFPASLAIHFEVLKDIPKLGDFDLNESEQTISFSIEDEDHAFQSGKAQVFHTQDYDNALASVDINPTRTSLASADLKEDQHYQLQISGDYCRVEDTNDQEHCHKDQTFFFHEFEFFHDYRLILDEYNVTDYVEQGNHPTLTFHSTNSRNLPVYQATVTIDGEPYTYDVTQTSPDNYQIVLNHTHAKTTPGKHNVSLDKITLESLQTFENGSEADYNVSALPYFVPGNAPTVDGLVLDQVEEQDAEQDQIKADFTLHDPNHTASKLTIILTDSTGRILAQNIIEADEFQNSDPTELSTTLNFKSKGSPDRHFTVKVLADYDLGDQYSFTQKPLASADLTLIDETKLHLDNLLTRDVRDSQNIRETRYAEKGQKNFEFAFRINLDKTYLAYANTSATSLTINGYNYPVQGTNVKDRNAAVYLGIPNRAGVIDIVASRIMYSVNNANSQYGHWYPIPRTEYQIEVLKDAPRIANLNAKPDYDNKSVTFDFDVVVDETATETDESFTAGTIGLGDQIDTELKRGHNSITFDEVEPDTPLSLVFTASYDRDTDQLNEIDGNRDENVHNLEPIYEATYTLRPDDYFENVEIKDLKLNREDDPAVYHKNEDIAANFKLAGLPEDLEAKPVKVVVQLGAESLEYPLTLNEDDTYSITLPGFYDAGPHTYTITGVVLDSGQVVDLAENTNIKLEVLKDTPTITDFSYEIGDDEITVHTKLNDPDQAIIGSPQTKVTDENDASVSDGEYQADFKFSKQDSSSERYYVSVTGNYLLAGTEQNNSNQYYHSNAELLSSIISLDDNYIELKDVLDYNLYKSVNGKTETVDEIRQADFNDSQSTYFVELYMADLPTLRAKVTSAKVKDNHLYLELEYQYTLVEGVDQTETLEVEYGELKDSVARNEFHPDIAFQKLVDELQSGGEVTLDRDYDAGSSATEQVAFVDNLNGHFDGAGHTIRNLKQPLFNNLNNATVENLYLENASLGNTANGVLANKTNNATIQNIAVYGLTTTNSQSNTGGLIGTADNHTKINNVAMSDLNMQGAGGQSNIAGIAGIFSNGSTLKDSYATGKIAVRGNFIAGMVGNVTSPDTDIQNVYAKVDLGSSNGSCGIACSQNVGAGINVSNSVSLSYNYATSPIGWRFKKLDNNFYYISYEKTFTDGDTNSTKLESDSDVNRDLFQTKANFSPTTWRLDSTVSYANPPKLSFERQTSSAIAADDSYQSDSVVAYNNLSQLAPFYKSAKIVSEGNAITDEHLQQKTIKHLVPLDANGSLVTYLTSDDLAKLTKLRIIYSDNTVETYDVKYDKTYDLVASYRIPALKTDYNFPHYIIDPNSQVVNHLVNYLNNLDYTANLDTLTKADDSRVLRDFYTDTTKTELKEFVLKFLSSSNYTNTGTNQSINDHLERQIRQSGELERSLYVYNFLRRFYDLDFNGLKFYDVVLYDMQGYDSALSAKGVVDTFLSNDSNFKTDWGDGTSTAYNRMFASKTGLRHIPNFIEYVAKHFSNITDMNDWVHHQFKGFLAERSIDDQPDYTSDQGVKENPDSTYKNTDVLYTLWDHFTHEDKLQKDEKYRIYNLVLPILTLPKDSTYIISTPAQFIIGSQRTYIADTTAPGAADSFAFRVNAYANRMKNYYTTAYGLVREPKDILNNLQLLTFDKNMAYNNNSTSITRQYRETTTDPHHKNFNEVIGRFAGNLGINAGAYGDRVEFDAAGVMDATIQEVADYLHVSPNESTFGTWSHETAHMIDARLWLEDNGRRWDAGGEDYADGNLRQEFSDNLIVMNLTRNLGTVGKDCKVASPCSYERIDTPDEVEDFYKNAFNVIYTIDYIEALAFLELSPEEQATMAVQISYPNITGENFTGNLKTAFPNGFKDDDAAKYRLYQTTQYKRLEAKDYEEMSLEDIDDLYDRQLMIYPGVYAPTSRGSNSYGGEGINVAHWYQPHNDYGRPDSYSLKWLAYEMLGYAGYEDGYIEYYSNINPSEESYTYYDNFETKATKVADNYKTDLMALQKITANSDITFETYKKDRFKEIEEKLQKLNPAINVEDYVKKFYEAFKKDHYRETVDLDKYFTTYHGGNNGYNPGNKEECLKSSWCVSGYAAWGWLGVANFVNKQFSTEVRKEIYQELKKLSNDFEDEDAIYGDSKQQKFSNIEELRQKIKEMKLPELHVDDPESLLSPAKSTSITPDLNGPSLGSPNLAIEPGPAVDQQQDAKDLDTDVTAAPADDLTTSATE